MSEWWAHTIGWGTVAALSCGFVLVEFAAPYAFLNDHPEDIRRNAPKPTAVQQRAGVLGGLVFFVSLIMGLGAVPWAWSVTHPDAGYAELALMTLVVAALFAVIDVVLVDWLIICTLRPRRFVYPGTENCTGWGDYAFHLTEQLRPRALLALTTLSAVVGTVVWWLT